MEESREGFVCRLRGARGYRIKETKDTYTGLVWLGDDALENGMIDGLSDLNGLARDVIGVNSIRYYQGNKSFIEEIMSDITSETSSKLSLYLNSLH